MKKLIFLLAVLLIGCESQLEVYTGGDEEGTEGEEYDSPEGIGEEEAEQEEEEDGLRQFGEPCTANADCESWLCVPVGGRFYCSVSCSDDSDCTNLAGGTCCTNKVCAFPSQCVTDGDFEAVFDGDETCDTNADCIDIREECQDGYCQCHPDTVRCNGNVWEGCSSEREWLVLNDCTDKGECEVTQGCTGRELGGKCEKNTDCDLRWCLTGEVLLSWLNIEVEIEEGYCSTSNSLTCANEGGHSIWGGVFGENYSSLSFCFKQCEDSEECRPGNSINCFDPVYFYNEGYILGSEFGKYFSAGGICIPDDFVAAIIEALSCEPLARRCRGESVIQLCLSDRKWVDYEVCETDYTCVEGTCVPIDGDE